jgi:Cu2+-exporting ATPase
VVLVNSRLQDVVAAIALSRKTLRNIRENLFWAFFYNCIGIPLAAGAFVSVFGWELNPMFGALAMSLSSFCVVSNALRLRRFRAPTPPEIELQTADAVENLQENKENLTMNISMTIKIEGMMCPHCSGRVKKLLEALDEITLAEVSHESGTAVITATADDADALRAKCAEVITEAGYTVVG